MVAVGDATSHARSLARAVYAERALKPSINEVVAAVLAGGDAPEDRPVEVELAQTVASLASVPDDARRRLATSLARQYGAERVVLVELVEGGPRARVVEGNRYLSVTLAPRRDEDRWRWDDAVAMLRGLSLGTPAPGPRKKPAKKRKPVPAPATSTAADEEESTLLTSPWFWTGLGVVTTVGVTVIVLSQTVFKDEESVTLQGQVGL